MEDEDGRRGDTEGGGLSLLDLPNELRLMIIEHLSPRDLGSIALVCRELYALQAHPHLWVGLFKQLLSTPRMLLPSSSRESAPSSCMGRHSSENGAEALLVIEEDGEDGERQLHSPVALTRSPTTCSLLETSDWPPAVDDVDFGITSTYTTLPAPPPPPASPFISTPSPSSTTSTPSLAAGPHRTSRSRSRSSSHAQRASVPFEDVWLLHARCRIGQALTEGRNVDWKREFIHRASFSVLIMAHHSAHQTYGSRYDLNLYRQLKRVGLPIVDICHPDCSEHDPLTQRERKCEDDALEPSDRYVEFEWEKIRHYSAIFLFFATAPSLENAAKMGDILHDFLKEGGGVVMGCYAYLDCNELRGRWSQSLYPMPSSDYGSGSKNWEKGKFLGTYITDHPIMQDVENIAIARDNRCESGLTEGALAVAYYGDGVPFVAMLDSETNRRNAADADDRPSSWGSTVYINLFPVAKSKQESGWYEASTDIPIVFRNALWHVARKPVSHSSAHQRSLA